MRTAQIVVVLGALLLATLIVAKQDSTFPTEADVEPVFDMLSFLDAQASSQENNKDVRCWSSTCKLQMFLAGAQFEPEAIAVRIELHMDLIESIWREARTAQPGRALEKRRSTRFSTVDFLTTASRERSRSSWGRRWLQSMSCQVGENR